MGKAFRQFFEEHQGKVSDKWQLYLDEWDRLLAPYQNKEISLLEIGIQNGGSLEIWGEYFPKAKTIIGCDIDQKCEQLKYDDPRIAVVVGDANSDDCKNKILLLAPSIDIVIDDGSHKSSDIVHSFGQYFPYLNDDGIYIIEDIHSSYWDDFEGGFNNPLSAMSFFKRVTDIINFEHWRNNKSRGQLLNKFAEQFGIIFDDLDLARIHSLEFINSLCIVRKSYPEKNVLGKRIIVGTDDSIAKGWKKLNGTSILDVSADIKDDSKLDIFEQISLTDSLAKKVIERDQTIQNLSKQVTEMDKQAAKLLDESAEKEKLFIRLQEQLAEKDKHAIQLQEQMAEKDKETASLQKQIMEQEQQAVELRNKLVKQEQTSKALHDKLIRQEQETHSLQQKSIESEEQVKGLSAKLAEQERQIYIISSQQSFDQQEVVRLQDHIQQREQILQNLNSTLLEIYSSTAWKIIKLLWKVRLWLAPKGSGREHLGQLVIRSMGVHRFQKDQVSSKILLENVVVRIDTPKNNELVKGSLSVSGWLLSKKRVSIEILIDNYPQDLKPNRHNRSDLLLAYPDYVTNTSMPGFSVIIDTQKLNNGFHRLSVQALLKGKIAGTAETIIEVYNSKEIETQSISDDASMIGKIKKVSIVIPTKNAGSLFQKILEGLKAQVYDGEIELIVVDSGSTDDTVTFASSYGAKTISINPNDFNHGLTRNRAIDASSGDIVVLMSQDVIPGDMYLIKNIVAAFDDPQIAGSYARQIPRVDADVLTQRNLNNWLTGRTTKEVRWIKDPTIYKNMSPFERYYFCNFDNVCSAIRKNVWKTIPFRANEFGEDIDWAQQILEAGWKIAYQPEAFVIHSHSRTVKYEYVRNYLCHKKLVTQFGINTVPSWKNVIQSSMKSIKFDWIYAVQNEKRKGQLLKLLIQIPAISFASVYGQYQGAKEGKKIKTSNENSRSLKEGI